MKKAIQILKDLGLLEKSWLNPLWLGVLPAIVIILLKPVDFNKYAIEVTDREKVDRHFLGILFRDLYNDGDKETIRWGENYTGNMYLYVYDENNKHLGQFNIDYPVAKTIHHHYPYFKDLNNDGAKEICFFSQNHDSVFLNIFNPASLVWEQQNIFVTKIGGKYSDKNDYDINWVDSDIPRKLFFTINSGFALYPRRVYKYDYQGEKLYPAVNTGVKQRVSVFKNSKNEEIFIATSSATENFAAEISIPYHDTASWLFLYDRNLHLINEPLFFIGNPASLSTVIGKTDDLFFCRHNNYGNNKKGSSMIFFNEKGELISDTSIYKTKRGNLSSIEHKNETRYFIQSYFLGQKNIVEFLPDKTAIKHTRLSKRLKKYIITSTFTLNTNKNNSTLTFLVNKKDNAIAIFQDGLKHEVQIPFTGNEQRIDYVSAKKHQNTVNISIETDTTHIFATYSKNPYYWLRLPFYLGVYLFSSLFVAVIMHYQKRRIDRVQKLEKYLANSQLQNVRNQLDPHFTFNTDFHT